MSDIATQSIAEARCPLVLPTADLTDHVRRLAAVVGVDLDPRTISSNKVGMVMQKLRLKQTRSEKQRGWQITPPAVMRVCAAYAIPLPDILKSLAPNSPP